MGAKEEQGWKHTNIPQLPPGKQRCPPLGKEGALGARGCRHHPHPSLVAEGSPPRLQNCTQHPCHWCYWGALWAPVTARLLAHLIQGYEWRRGLLDPADSSSLTRATLQTMQSPGLGGLQGRRMQAMLSPAPTRTHAVHHLLAPIGQYFHHTQNIYFSKTIANDNGYIL